VTGSWDESFKIWTIAAGSPRSLCRVPVPGGGAVNSVAFSPAGESFQILTAHDDGTARLWNWDPRTPEIPPAAHAEFAHSKAVNAAVFSHDGTRLLTLCADGVGRVWDPAAELRKPLFELAGQHTGPILCGVFSSDGNWIATGGEDKQIVLWNAHSGQPALDVPLQGHSAAITSLALTEKGERLLTGSRDSTAKLWDLQVNVPHRPALPVSESELETDASSDEVKPDPKAGVTIAARLRGKELLTLRGHSAEITSVAFSPDGRFVLTAGLDNSAILWLTNKP
jgi:WD40 repeat protein